MSDLKAVLTTLKADAKVKGYRDQPETFAVHGDFVLTFCLEKTMVGIQPTLAISRRNRKPVYPLPPSFVATTVEVFGAAPDLVADQVYPKRGETLLFIWGAKALARDRPR